MAKWVYGFRERHCEGRAEMRNLLGGKGANLAEMSRLGLPVPPGFTITTETLHLLLRQQRILSVRAEKKKSTKAVAAIERTVGAGFGDANNPLLVSVRSGARASMPGMMDTVLNLGSTTGRCGARQVVGRRALRLDSYRRFIQMYSNVVLDVGHHYFEEALELRKEDLGVHMDTELKSDDWRMVVAEYKKIVEKRTGNLSLEPREQLWGAIGAVFGSWMNQRAITYRRLHAIPESWGTAVTVQAMVFGKHG